jgi:hypothetical protein
MSELQIPQETKFVEQCRRNWIEQVDRIPKKDLKILIKNKNFGKPSEMMEGFCL